MHMTREGKNNKRTEKNEKKNSSINFQCSLFSLGFWFVLSFPVSLCRLFKKNFKSFGQFKILLKIY